MSRTDTGSEEVSDTQLEWGKTRPSRRKNGAGAFLGPPGSLKHSLLLFKSWKQRALGTSVCVAVTVLRSLDTLLPSLTFPNSGY